MANAALASGAKRRRFDSYRAHSILRPSVWPGPRDRIVVSAGRERLRGVSNAGRLAVWIHPFRMMLACGEQRSISVRGRRSRATLKSMEVSMLVASDGVMFGGILFFIIWVLIAFWPARVAGRKGHSFFLYFLFSLVFFPAALIVAYMVRDRTVPALA